MSLASKLHDTILFGTLCIGFPYDKGHYLIPAASSTMNVSTNCLEIDHKLFVSTISILLD